MKKPVMHYLAAHLTYMVVFLACLQPIGQVLFAQPAALVQENPVALLNGDIFLPGGEIIQKGILLFENGMISGIGTQVDLPAETETIDVSGKQVHPGLILGRTTLGLTEIGRLAESTDLEELGDINPNVMAEVAFHSASEHLGVAAIHGITAAVSMPSGGMIAGQAAAMMTSGWTWEQMVLKAPVGMVVNWPSESRAELHEKAMAVLQKAFDEARRYQLAREATGPAWQSDHPVDLRWESMMPVLKNELPLLIIANSITQIQSAMAWTQKEGLSMVLVGGRDAGYMADQLAEYGIPVMVTPVISGPARAWEGYNHAYRLPALLHASGVKFCIAGEPSAAGAYRLAHHASAAVAFGLPRQAAMDAITTYAAEILGIDHLTGSIEIGKQADIMVTSGDPLETESTTDMVFSRGIRVPDADKHKQLYDLYMEKHRQENR